MDPEIRSMWITAGGILLIFISMIIFYFWITAGGILLIFISMIIFYFIAR